MIRVNHLSKFYGTQRALGPISFEIKDGETVGFLGLNGAGKTTTLRMLACDLRPSGGRIEVDGVDAVANPHEVRKHIGFVPEHPPLYADMDVTSFLTFAAELRGMKRAAITPRLRNVLEMTDLTEVAHAVIGTLSHGFRQRVGIAQAIIHAPRFLVLDEPTRGLDPRQTVEMRNLLRDLKQNHTVLISSHILPEISQTCDRLLVIDKGAIIGQGTEQDLAAQAAPAQISQLTVLIRANADTPLAADAAKTSHFARLLSAIDGVTKVTELYVDGEAHCFELATNADSRAVVSRGIIEAKLDLLKLDYAHTALENTFIRLLETPQEADHARN